MFLQCGSLIINLMCLVAGYDLIKWLFIYHSMDIPQKKENCQKPVHLTNTGLNSLNYEQLLLTRSRFIIIILSLMNRYSIRYISVGQWTVHIDILNGTPVVYMAGSISLNYTRPRIQARGLQRSTGLSTVARYSYSPTLLPL